MSLELTAKQREAFDLLAQDQRYTLLYGGTRSAKTFTLLLAILMRCANAPGSRHLVARYRRNAVTSTVVKQTLPALKQLAFAGQEWELHKQEGILTLPGGSEVWFDGLDENDRVEKILGTEFATIFFNEASQIPYPTYQVVRLRCAQVCERLDGELLPQRVYVDENPPSKAHWTYSLFFEGRDPDTRKHLHNPEDYKSLQMNPVDNAENLSREFLAELEHASIRYKKRFYLGEFADTDVNALWKEETIDRYRLTDEPLPDMQRVVVAVDPSGAADENSESDDIGMVVVGMGINGEAYVLEDVTLKAGPSVWGKAAITAFERHEADVVVAEENYGGAMVRHVIRTAKPGTPYKSVKATRGKVIRAEPISVLYEQGKVHHVGYFPELEQELLGFQTTGYIGTGSPNRADALVWALTELFPSLTKTETQKQEIKVPHLYHHYAGAQGWML